jgi:glycosyltransferase involved in cell wall biosynthesis
MNVMAGFAAHSEPFSQRARKVVLLSGEDAFLLSHARVLLAVLGEVSREVVAIAHSTGRLGELEALGARVIDFDCRARWRNPVADLRSAWSLARILEAEAADAVHCVGVGPSLLACLALQLLAVGPVVVHLPHIDPLVSARGAWGWLYRRVAPKLIASTVRRPTAFLLVECPDDLAVLRAQGVDPGARFAVLGGCGIDPDMYPVLPPAQEEMPVAAFVGEMAASNGVEVLMRAFDRVWARGVRLRLELVGESATGGPNAVSTDQLTLWGLRPGVHLLGPEADVREVWRRSEICVLPALGRQGTPRTLLEAAACGRALIVTEGAGGGSFVRDGVEGLVVPCGDASALAEALERLARDGELRQRLGEAARLRVLQGYTEAHVKQALLASYASLLGVQQRA